MGVLNEKRCKRSDPCYTLHKQLADATIAENKRLRATTMTEQQINESLKTPNGIQKNIKFDIDDCENIRLDAYNARKTYFIMIKTSFWGGKSRKSKKSKKSKKARKSRRSKK